MESALSLICEHAHHAHWLVFFLLLLAGLNVPISSDVIILTAGAIASTCIPEHAYSLYAFIYVGYALAAWEAYWIGRLLGPQLYRFRWLSHVITPTRLEKLRHYYAKYGLLTFIVGRFIPGGVRNAMFMSSGLIKMPFHLFILRDGLAAFISSLFLFSVGFIFGEHIEEVKYYFYRYAEIILALGCLGIVCAFAYFRYKKKR